MPAIDLLRDVTSFVHGRGLNCRLLEESGRLSNAPSFVVGIFSGASKLGEGVGSSLKMAETRVCTHAWSTIS